MAPAWKPKPPVEKLPLAVRKNGYSREFESKKEEYETTIAGLLGFPVTISLDVNAICAYADLSSASVGTLLAGYIDGFIDALTSYTRNFEDVGKEYFKNVVTESKLTVTVNDHGEKANTIDADVKDGVFRILFNHSQFGYNTNWLHDPSTTQASTKWTENWEHPEEKSDQEWQGSFGTATLQYFQEGIVNQLTNQGFHQDEMLQEGFAEAVTSKTFKLRIVDKTKSGSSNETVLEDATIYIQTTVEMVVECLRCRQWYS
ncbi:hypothetical protein BJ912DRAFT_1124812 [Pholiota molesta]|nr:hypothetical protein BJ912DRAFT_1124812 [Pholiota molesta]